jgi:phosphatidylglycerophosphate synthase
MFDDQLRLRKEKIFMPLTRPLRLLPPWALTLVAFVMGLATAVALAGQHYTLGLILWFLNRLFDGLDGTLARRQKTQSDFGGYLDILLDFVVYAAVPLGLVLGRPSSPAYISLAILLSSFYINAASWMHLAAILEKRQRSQGDGLTSITMPAGLIGGAETIVFYLLFMLFPNYFIWLFNLMSVLVAFTVGQRLIWAYRRLG